MNISRYIPWILLAAALLAPPVRAQEQKPAPAAASTPKRQLSDDQVKQILAQQRNVSQAQLLLNFFMNKAYEFCGGVQFYRENEQTGWPECFQPAQPAPPAAAPAKPETQK
ncbi:MAG TPA: hypothetical protein VN841_29205 [Bryobacteraceae bacterium]|nr:hypothetical protein [Bryobacteraceae bacterium]